MAIAAIAQQVFRGLPSAKAIKVLGIMQEHAELPDRHPKGYGKEYFISESAYVLRDWLYVAWPASQATRCIDLVTMRQLCRVVSGYTAHRYML